MEKKESCLLELLELHKQKELLEKELHKKGREYYNEEKKKIEQIASEKRNTLLSAIATAEEEIDKVGKNICELGIHLCCTVYIKDETIKVDLCGICGKIISATTYNSEFGKVQIPESEYSQLSIPEGHEAEMFEFALERLASYFRIKSKFEGTKDEFMIKFAFNNIELMEYYKQIDFENPEFRSLYLRLQEAIKTKKQLDKELYQYSISEEEEEEKKRLMTELCNMFGHDVPATAYENDLTKCKCCGKTQEYIKFVNDWEKAPLYDAVFEYPVVKPKPEVKTVIKTEIRDRSPRDPVPGFDLWYPD